MLFHYNYFKKRHVGENMFVNLAVECSLILDYSIHKIFRDVSEVGGAWPPLALALLGHVD